MLLQNTP